MNFVNKERNKSLRSYSEAFGSCHSIDRKLTPIKEYYKEPSHQMAPSPNTIKKKMEKYLCQSRKVPTFTSKSLKQREPRSRKKYFFKAVEGIKRQHELSTSLRKKHKMLIEEEQNSLKSKKDSSLLIKEIKLKTGKYKIQQEAEEPQPWFLKPQFNKVFAFQHTELMNKTERKYGQKNLTFYGKEKNLDNNFIQSRYPKMKVKLNVLEKEEFLEPWDPQNEEVQPIFF